MSKEQQEQPQETQEPKMREIVIETDGNTIKIKKAEVVGSLEFKAILLSLLDNLK